MTVTEIQQLQEMAKTIRGLSIDGIQKANSGHPGLPMGMADAASVLWMKHLKHNPNDPKWIDRDRFVLSAGHGSMLIYSLLHLTGYDLSLDELKNFRQWDSKTPGHPEYGHTAGIETTTGPLGQGVANGVGMAIAEKRLAAHFNKSNETIVDHYTYVIAGDGCMMEGISHEACSLAGHLKLGKLILLYDDNNISIDGPTELSFSEDVLKRFESYNWHTQRIDGHDLESVNSAIDNAKNDNRPSIIACKTIIGFGSPNKAGTSGVHGSPLGDDEIILTKEKLGLPTDKTFYISEEVLQYTHTSANKGSDEQGKWQSQFKNYKNNNRDAAHLLKRIMKGQLPENWQDNLPEFEAGTAMATRSASGKVLDALTPNLFEMLGGSADLTPSNNTFPKDGLAINPENFDGNYLHYGVREHATAAIMNGLALHGGIIPYGGTFLVFSDYMRNSIRLSAMMGIRVIYVFTHDSIGLGEDGPTHQPIEHLASLRTIPNLTVIRPSDAAETIWAWESAINNTSGPTALILTRQKLANPDRKNLAAASNVQKGGYIFSGMDDAKVALIASGSEVEIAMDAQKILNKKGIASRVISMPSCELFDQQNETYKQAVLPKEMAARVAIEAGSDQSWYKYVGSEGKIISIDGYGTSAPYDEIYKQFGLTAENVAEHAISLIK
ncbi:MAG: transketolase [Calditrichaeota bacterium]|nr:MAG: transketolase [Calditrichota bacterium]MBL1206173.1 transketolase [Calditrichota bacterium]NOG45998.1 transketolase [Calditrichota bacterium]